MPLNSPTLNALNYAITKRECIKKNSNAIRLVNSKGDGLEGLVLEQYQNHFVAQIFNSLWLNQSKALMNFLLEKFKVDFFIVKDRSISKLSTSQAFQTQILIDKKGSKTFVEENKILFEVDLNDGLNTGLFLDMRANRLLVGQQCTSKRVLNCFSYTCSFGTYAKYFNALEVINIDISKKILERGMRNYELNKFDFSKEEFVKADALKYLARAVKKDNLFDIIIIDPPSFSRVDGEVFNIQKSLPNLLTDALKVLKSQGKIFLSTNFSGLTHFKLEEMLKKSSSRKIKEIKRLGQDKDFVGSNQNKESYLAAVLVEY